MTDNDEIKICQRLLIPISHIESRFHLVDQNGCTFAQSVTLYEGFASIAWKPIKSKLPFKGTKEGLHCWDVNRWSLFCPINLCVVTYRLVKCQYFFSSPVHSLMRLVWGERKEGNIILMFSN